MKRNANRARKRRRGVTLLFTVVVVTILLALSLLTTRSIVAVHQQRHTHVNALQADFLVDSGIERAIAKRAASPDYEGEVWEVNAETDDIPGTAIITINIKPIDERLQLSVKVQHDIHGQQTVASRSLLLPPKKESP